MFFRPLLCILLFIFATHVLEGIIALSKQQGTSMDVDVDVDTTNMDDTDNFRMTLG